MSDIDLADIDFDALQDCGISMLELGVLYLYIFELINNPDQDIEEELGERIMMHIYDKFREIQQDYFKDKEIYHLGEKIGEALEDFMDWQSTFTEMGFCEENE